MICDNTGKNQKIKSSTPEPIQVCIPREGTARTRMLLCEWKSGIPDYPVLQGNEEFICYVLEGEGSISSENTKTELRKGTFVYLPSHIDWQLESIKDKPLKHLLFSALLNREPSTQRQPKVVHDIMGGRRYEFGSNSTILVLDRAETEQCETTVVSWPPHNRGAMVAHNDKEQTFYVLGGSGNVTVDGETRSVSPGDIIFVPFNNPHTTEAGNETLTYLCINTIVAEKKYTSFDEMYHVVVEDRMRRWKEKDDSVGL
ncbi:MAG: cupin domain-containing protein [Bacteroidales bacterium]|nr:cupin domain-containing protein [Bacteroidales bacterium]